MLCLFRIWLTNLMDCGLKASSVHGDSGNNGLVLCPPQGSSHSVIWTQNICIFQVDSLLSDRRALLTSAPEQPQIHFLLLSIYLFWIFLCGWNCTICGSLYLAPSFLVSKKFHSTHNVASSIVIVTEYYSIVWIGLIYLLPSDPVDDTWVLFLTIKHSTARVFIFSTLYTDICSRFNRCMGKWNCWVI